MAGFPPAYLSSTSNSLTDLLRDLAPEALPRWNVADHGAQVPEGTTIICFRTASGILMAGDRRATIGNLIASHAMV